jgi:hypothetical protein
LARLGEGVAEDADAAVELLFGVRGHDLKAEARLAARDGRVLDEVGDQPVLFENAPITRSTLPSAP